jgi:hypothetical protein
MREPIDKKKQDKRGSRPRGLLVPFFTTIATALTFPAPMPYLSGFMAVMINCVTGGEIQAIVRGPDQWMWSITAGGWAAH